MSMTIPIQPGFRKRRALRNETRSADRLYAHYQIETRLARNLVASTRTERAQLYSAVYRELFATVPDHPQHRASRTGRAESIRRQAAALLAGLPSAATYVEIGCGDAALTKQMAEHLACAIGIDVTPDLVTPDAPPGFRFLQSDGVSLDLPDHTADLVFSNQLMEHLHVEDAIDQLREIFRILKPGGRYVCCTPNRLTGPHDISAYFDRQPHGFHLREYDHRSLAGLFRQVGFRKTGAMMSLKGRRFTAPVALIGAAEAMLEHLPGRLRRAMADSSIAMSLFGVTLVGTK